MSTELDNLAPGTAPVSLWPLVQTLRQNCEFTDLTHSFAPGQPRFPTLPDEVRTVLKNHREHNVLLHRYELVGQWGTHVDPPSHFIEGGRSLDDIAISEMICPLVVLASLIELRLTQMQYRRWLRLKPMNPAGAEFQRARSSRCDLGGICNGQTHPSSKNRDSAGIAHCPGWSLPVLQCLIEERGISAIGHDTLDTDPGTAWSQGDFSLERYVLSKGCWQIEALTNLDRVPEHGAIILATGRSRKGLWISGAGHSHPPGCQSITDLAGRGQLMGFRIRSWFTAGRPDRVPLEQSAHASLSRRDDCGRAPGCRAAQAQH